MGRLSCMEGGEAVTNEAEAALDFIQVANAHILPISCVPGVMVHKPWPKRVNISGWFDWSKDETWLSRLTLFLQCKPKSHVTVDANRWLIFYHHWSGQERLLESAEAGLQLKPGQIVWKYLSWANQIKLLPYLPNPFVLSSFFPGLFSSWHKIMKQGVLFGLLQAPFLKPFI